MYFVALSPLACLIIFWIVKMVTSDDTGAEDPWGGHSFE